MSFKQINEQCYYYESSVNVGYVQLGSSGVLIDAGIDASSVKKILKELKNRELPLTHLFITHAHADHYGGASYIQERYDVYTMAPSFEEAILRNPSLEPLYLFGGNDPLDELKNKFLQGPPMKVDQIVEEGSINIGGKSLQTVCLPGHSYYQLALLVDGILYAADSYFSLATLKKHKIPFLTDAKLAIESLHKLLEMDLLGAVPGHGTFEENPIRTIEGNIRYHEGLMEWLFQYVSSVEEGVSHEEAVAQMCNHFGVSCGRLSQWLLQRTAVTAYIIGLKKNQRLADRIVHNRWVLKAHDE
ncbi:MBL fold metallo-hydrolase [Halobacillus locisalis]|uniref:MBL fold metallo-hydrolase n=1 Tax=Halobacillus locisalis TaxID=220753 RepID=A0A838CR79_9BACI|nr:MBL fold metallo-hydrolase [Halobacillus locisalis]MBA2174461.1 MBL fold metallo-hydrolase [Halobacillus locisalis]